MFYIEGVLDKSIFYFFLSKGMLEKTNYKLKIEERSLKYNAWQEDWCHLLGEI